MLDDYLRLRNSGCRWHPSQSIPHRVRELGASSDLETSSDGDYDRAATGGGGPGRGGAGDCTLTGHRFAAGDTLSVLCFNSAPAEANQRQHCNLATSVAFDAEEAMVEERARGRPK